MESARRLRKTRNVLKAMPNSAQANHSHDNRMSERLWLSLK